jgi:hypothetical protein
MWPRNKYVLSFVGSAYEDSILPIATDPPVWAARTYGKANRRAGSFASQRTSPTFRKGRDGRMERKSRAS